MRVILLYCNSKPGKFAGITQFYFLYHQSITLESRSDGVALDLLSRNMIYRPRLFEIS